MKNKSLVIILFLILLVLPSISATDTKITIKTVPNYKVMISALKTGQVYSLINSFNVNSGTTGEVSVTLSSSDSNFNVGVWVKKDNINIVSKKFENEYPAGTPITLEIYPDWYVPPVKEEVKNETNLTIYSEPITNQVLNNFSNETENIIIKESNNKTLNEITGKITQNDENTGDSKTIYYIIGGLILLGLIIFGIKRFSKKREFGYENQPQEIKIRKLSDIRREKEENNIKLIEDAEKKIKDAKSEIDQLKKNQIQSFEKKINEERKELSELKRREGL